MITYTALTTIEDFENIITGDFLAVEWHRDSYIGNKKCRFAVYQVHENLKHSTGYTEIVLQKKNNVYFNYKMFLNPELGISNAKNVVLIKGDGK